MWPTLRRFLPYLWPAGEPGLKARIVGAMLLVALSKVTQVYVTAYSLKWAVDAMARRATRGAVWSSSLLVVGYAGARFATTLFDNLRNALFERVGQDATRRLAAKRVRAPPPAVAALSSGTAHGRGDQGGRARHQEHRYDAVLHAVQHRADGAGAGAGAQHLPVELRLGAGRGDGA